MSVNSSDQSANVAAGASPPIAANPALSTATSDSAIEAAVPQQDPLPLPNKPLTSYLIFRKEMLDGRWAQMSESEREPFLTLYTQEKQENPEKKNIKTAYMRFCDSLGISQRWKSMPAEEKAVYTAKSRDMYATYAAEMETYNQRYLEHALSAPAPPRKPKNAYMHFTCAERAAANEACAKARAANEQRGEGEKVVAVKKTTKQLAEQWAKMTSEEREPYVQLEAQERAAHADAIVAYENQWGALSYIAALKKKQDVADEKRAVKLAAAEADKATSDAEWAATVAWYRQSHLRSALERFTRNMLDNSEQDVEFDRSQTIAAIDAAWEALSDGTKKTWRRKYRASQSTADATVSAGADEESSGRPSETVSNGQKRKQASKAARKSKKAKKSKGDIFLGSEDTDDDERSDADGETSCYDNGDGFVVEDEEEIDLMTSQEMEEWRIKRERRDAEREARLEEEERQRMMYGDADSQDGDESDDDIEDDEDDVDEDGDEDDVDEDDEDDVDEDGNEDGDNADATSMDTDKSDAVEEGSAQPDNV